MLWVSSDQATQQSVTAKSDWCDRLSSLLLCFADLLSQSPRAAATHREMAPTVAPVVSGGDGHLHVCPHGHVKAAPVGKRSERK